MNAEMFRYPEVIDDGVCNLASGYMRSRVFRSGGCDARGKFKSLYCGGAGVDPLTPFCSRQKGDLASLLVVNLYSVNQWSQSRVNLL